MRTIFLTVGYIAALCFLLWGAMHRQTEQAVPSAYLAVTSGPPIPTREYRVVWVFLPTGATG